MNDLQPISKPVRGSRITGILITVIKIVLPLMILAAAGLSAKQMIDNPPKTQRRPGVRQAVLVETGAVTVRPEPVMLEAMGAVVASQQLQIKPEVSGRIVWLAENLEPGSHFQKGSPLAKIERRDFELALAERKSELQQAQAAFIEAERSLITARANLQIEMGNQAVAQRELEVLAEQIKDHNRDLVLRRPQLETAKAQVKAAEAALASAKASIEGAKARKAAAELELERTTIVAPFDLIVENKLSDLGDRVSTSTGLLEVIGSRTFWIEVALSQSDLHWVIVSQPGETEENPRVRIYNDAAWSGNQHRLGRVIRLLPTVDSKGRMARVLVAVDDPLSIEDSHKSLPPLLAGSYVRVEIEGPTIDSSVSIDRSWLRDSDSVWVMTEDERLDIRPVKVLHRGRDHILVRNGLTEGERIVTTDLASPVAGMALRTDGQPNGRNAESSLKTGGGGQ